MDILALDLGTKTGYAYNKGSQFLAGTWKLATPKEITAWGKTRLNRRRDPRPGRLCEKVLTLGHFDVIVFEDVTFSSTTYQTQLWSALRSSLWVCLHDDTPFDCVPVQTLKKFATGAGGASKEEMTKFLLLRPDMKNLPKLDDNGVDACWLWIWAQKNLAKRIL